MCRDPIPVGVGITLMKIIFNKILEGTPPEKSSSGVLFRQPGGDSTPSALCPRVSCREFRPAPWSLPGLIEKSGSEDRSDANKQIYWYRMRFWEVQFVVKE